MSIKKQLGIIKNELPNNVTLVAVSKNKSNSQVLKAYYEGHRIFGENKVQELLKKQEELPKDIEWHLIGHLQKNKVKHIAPFISLIHSVDSIGLLQEINKRAIQYNRKINCLIQVKIAQEEKKYGFRIDEIEDVLSTSFSFKNLNIIGLMGMSTFTNNSKQIQNEFMKLKQLFDKIKNNQINILSMGMSNDYPIAIKNGSTMVRVGSAIFGNRN